jgi:hypothetical protein
LQNIKKYTSDKGASVKDKKEFNSIKKTTPQFKNWVNTWMDISWKTNYSWAWWCMPTIPAIHLGSGSRKTNRLRPAWATKWDPVWNNKNLSKDLKVVNRYMGNNLLNTIYNCWNICFCPFYQKAKDGKYWRGCNKKRTLEQFWEYKLVQSLCKAAAKFLKTLTVDPCLIIIIKTILVINIHICAKTCTI